MRAVENNIIVIGLSICCIKAREGPNNKNHCQNWSFHDSGKQGLLIKWYRISGDEKRFVYNIIFYYYFDF